MFLFTLHVSDKFFWSLSVRSKTKKQNIERVPHPNGPSKYTLRSSIRSMMPRMFPSRPIGMFTNAVLWLSLDLENNNNKKTTFVYRRPPEPRCWERAQKPAVPQLLQGSDRVGSLSVQFVYEGEERHVVALHLPVHRHGLTLDAAHRAQDQHCPVQHAQRSLHLDGKVHVTWETNSQRFRRFGTWG